MKDWQNKPATQGWLFLIKGLQGKERHLSGRTYGWVMMSVSLPGYLLFLHGQLHNQDKWTDKKVKKVKVNDAN